MDNSHQINPGNPSFLGLGTSEPLPRLQKTKLGTLQEWLWQWRLTLKNQRFHVFSFYDVLLVSQMVGFTQSQTAKSSHGWDKTCMPGTALLSRVTSIQRPPRLHSLWHGFLPICGSMAIVRVHLVLQILGRLPCCVKCVNVENKAELTCFFLVTWIWIRDKTSSSSDFADFCAFDGHKPRMKGTGVFWHLPFQSHPQ